MKSGIELDIQSSSCDLGFSLGACLVYETYRGYLSRSRSKPSPWPVLALVQSSSKTSSNTLWSHTSDQSLTEILHVSSKVMVCFPEWGRWRLGVRMGREGKGVLRAGGFDA